MIIGIDTENVFDKIQHTFVIKALSKVRLEETHLSIVKATSAPTPHLSSSSSPLS